MLDLTAFKNAEHSPLSASGSERWLNCPASVALSLNQPEPPSSKYALEGTRAHDYLEEWLIYIQLKFKGLEGRDVCNPYGSDKDMYFAILTAVEFAQSRLRQGFKMETEEKLSLAHIHPSMFGTTDTKFYKEGSVLEIWDYKHGKGKVVEVYENGMPNTQLVYYGLAAAHKYNYDFKKVRLGIIQPRAKHINGPIRSTVLSMPRLKKYIDVFKKGVDNVFSKNPEVVTGPWCHWCKAQNVCPKQQKIRSKKVVDLFED